MLFLYRRGRWTRPATCIHPKLVINDIILQYKLKIVFTDFDEPLEQGNFTPHFASNKWLQAALLLNHSCITVLESSEGFPPWQVYEPKNHDLSFLYMPQEGVSTLFSPLMMSSRAPPHPHTHTLHLYHCLDLLRVCLFCTTCEVIMTSLWHRHFSNFYWQPSSLN